MSTFQIVVVVAVVGILYEVIKMRESYNKKNRTLDEVKADALKDLFLGK